MGEADTTERRAEIQKHAEYVRHKLIERRTLSTHRVGQDCRNDVFVLGLKVIAPHHQSQISAQHHVPECGQMPGQGVRRQRGVGRIEEGRELLPEGLIECFCQHVQQCQQLGAAHALEGFDLLIDRGPDPPLQERRVLRQGVTTGDTLKQGINECQRAQRHTAN